MTAITTLAGHFHPVLVHLPIGILLLALFLEWLSLKPKYEGWRPAAHMALGLGAIAAIFSCITGYFESQTGDYDTQLVNTHKWLAIIMTATAIVLYYLTRKGVFGLKEKIGTLVTLSLLIATGHLGGTLTHGPGYLTEGLGEPDFTRMLKPIPNIDSADVYAQLVQPVLHDNCYRCHSSAKQKGGLRLDEPKWIMKGGKDGAVITPGHAQTSEIIKRIMLPLDDEHHMAPKEKTQLTKDEVALLKWWIDAGAPTDKQVRELPKDSTIKNTLLAFAKGTAGPTADAEGPLNVADSDMPREPVHAAGKRAIERLEAQGAQVLPIADGSPYLAIGFINDTIGKDGIDALKDVSDQLVSLKCSFLPIKDDALPTIGKCTHLVRLWLDHTQITGNDLQSLQSLSNLKYLNLTNTNVNIEHLKPLQSLPQLKELYLYQTKVDKSNWAALQKDFPHTRLDSGGYNVPFLTTDTAIVRAPARKN